MQDKRTWKILLLIGAITFGFWSLVYTNKLVRTLQREETKKIKQYAEALKLQLTIDEENQDAFNFIKDIIKNNETIPVIYTDDKGNLIDFVNIDPEKIKDPAYFKEKLEDMKATHTPIVIEFEGMKNYIYYETSTILNLLSIYPYVQLIIISLFIFVSYLAFNSSRKSEQNRIWVGMAKETAHQLGTPVSSIMAWIDYIKEAPPGSDNTEVLNELSNDVRRLELIVDRFSKIGSAPVLTEQYIYDILERALDYLEKRVSKQVNFSIVTVNESLMVYVNVSLFDWVVENICKNAIDAMDGKGNIFVDIKEDTKYIIIDIKDTGKGIASNKLKTVFNPGFTTKKRGWGLGLSLSKRIIESYHGGKVFVKESEVNKGTTFRIMLKKVVA